jgi:formylglycine-generating enzyme required for sulfatase activity
MKRIFALLLLPACIDAAERFPATIANPCDGAPTCPSDMVQVIDAESYAHQPGSLTIQGGKCVCVDRYEASQGPAGKAESAAGRDPWVRVDFAEASAACVAAGKRLCTGREWTAACSGIPVTSFPYGNDYDPRACNTTSTVARTGSFAACEGSRLGLYDLSGNVAEWTGVATDATRCDPEIGCVSHGGSMSGSKAELACGFRAGLTATATSAEIGFRCCKSP